MNPDRFKKFSSPPPQAPTPRRTPLMRDASGRLRPDKGDHEIGDVWEQQRRIRLAEALVEKKRRRELRDLRRKKGLFGLVRAYYDELLTKTRTELFGTDAAAEAVRRKAAKPAGSKPIPGMSSVPAGPHRQSPTARPTAGRPPASAITVAASRLRRLTGHGMSLLHRFWKQADTRTRLATGASAAVVCLLVIGAMLAASRGSSAEPAKTGSKPTAGKQPSAGSGGLQKGTPAYQTVTPDGKDISAYGGWTKVSPPGKDPVFAYSDKLDGIAIAVSQQPLPDDFRKNTASKVEELAKNFGATDKLPAGTVDAFIGTSAKGPQSVIFFKGDLLILIKSSSAVRDDHWVDYIGSLR